MNELVIKNWKVINAPEGLSGYWMTGEEIGKHLGYADPRKAINNLFNANSQTFVDKVDTSVLESRMEAGIRTIRVFSERGALKLVRYKAEQWK